MIGRQYKINQHSSLMQRYSAQLGMIVERNRAEMALMVAKQEAEFAAEKARLAMLKAQAADRAKTDFLANMSHELRTPLNAIIGFSDMMLLLGPKAEAKFQEYAKDISTSGHLLLELINDILDLAKVESGKLDLDETMIDVESTVSACMNIIKERAQERSLTLNAKLPDRFPALCADERKLKQILINLLSNAVKFTPEGGRIVLTVHLDVQGSLVFKITDNGIGIASKDIARALTPFEQVDSRPDVKLEGTGLGLPLTKGLVELHGGTLSIESKVGHGTAVTVKFPRERVAALAA